MKYKIEVFDRANIQVCSDEIDDTVEDVTDHISLLMIDYPEYSINITPILE